MKILYGTNDNVDFDAPIKMTPEQQKKFISFMESMFKVVKPVYVDETRTDRIGDKFFSRKWDNEEYYYLYDMSADTDEVAAMLGRSWMSVNVKRGQFLSAFLYWAEVHKKDLIKGDIKELITEFLKSKEAKRNEKKRQRTERKKKERLLEEYEDELEGIPKRREHLDFYKKFNEVKPEAYEKINKREAELRKLIDELRKELGNSD